MNFVGLVDNEPAKTSSDSFQFFFFFGGGDALMNMAGSHLLVDFNPCDLNTGATVGFGLVLYQATQEGEHPVKNERNLTKKLIL